MIRRKALKNIAAGLCSSFMSRNNDVDGYWGIGKLCLFSQQRKTQSVRLDVLACESLPASEEFLGLMRDYHLRLQKHLKAKNIPESCVKSVVFEVEFNADTKALWALFKVTASITDDENITRCVAGFGRCLPHSAKRELRSARVSS